MWIAKLSVTVAILSYIFNRIPLGSVLEAWQKIELSALLVLCPIIVLSFVVSARQLKVFTDNHDMRVSLPRIFAINLSTEFYNLFLPSYLAGGAIRWHKLSNENKKRAEAFSALVLNRLVNTLTLAFFGMICWTYDSTSIPQNYYGLVFLALCLVLIPIYSFLFSHYATSTNHVVSRHPTLQKIPSLIRRGLINLFHAAREYRQLTLKEHGYILFLSCSWQILGILFFYTLGQSLGMQMSIESLGWIRSILGFLLLFPISVSGFGVREGALLIFLGYYGMDPAMTIAFSFLLFARTLLLGLTGAVYEAKMMLIPANPETSQS